VIYEVRVEWDEEAKVWYVAETNVPGLVTEAETIEAMLAKLNVMVPEMLEENGLTVGADVPFELLASRHAVAHRVV
jgi:predicted RNase H-like HicB family nuclease